ncbi:MAG: RNA methyltransferase [Planctomycetes bacterium]|nr:RNA methyltransferase [Planctomycetota bacterium]
MNEREAPRRLRRAEAVLRRRTSRLTLVLERPWDDHNVQAALRTAESFGVQHIWMVKHPDGRHRISKSVTKGSHYWLSQKIFETIPDCISALQKGGYTIWATDLSSYATELCSGADLHPFPEKVAIVVGREADGVSPEMLAAADRRLYLPMQGFTESFNLSVATALILQRCFDADPTLVGAMSQHERAEIRRDWFRRLAGAVDGRAEEYAHWAESPPNPLKDPRPSDEARRPRIPKKVRKRITKDKSP